MLAQIYYFKDGDFYEFEECESATRARTVLLSRGYILHGRFMDQELWRGGYYDDGESRTATIIRVREN